MKRRNSPRVSILIPVYNTEPEILEQCIESVVSQHYKNWQLCIVDDGSTESNVLDVLRRWKKLDRRIRIKFSKKNQGIAATINLCAKMARGKYIGVLDHDDLLEPSAISDYIQLIRRSPKADVIYCDEDKIDLDGQFIEPWHKSDWNPDLALCFNYVMHFVVVRRKLFKRIGGVRTDYEGSQDYDFLLRVTELTDNIHHIPKILYHWRLGPDSIAGGPGAKPEVFVNGLAALSAALERRGIQGQAVDAPDAWKGVYRVIRDIDDQIKCSIIVIIIGESLEATERLVSSINNYAPRNSELILVTSRPEKELKGMMGIESENIHILEHEEMANKALAFNAGAKLARNEILFFLDDTMELTSESSYTEILQQAQRDEVGAAGPKVLYANGLIEHAGVIFGPHGIMGYANRATPDNFGYAGLNRMISNYSAVMGLGMMTSRRLFTEVGGFDENLPSAYWDADYCLKLRDLGYLITFTPYAVLKHHIEIPSITSMNVEPDATYFRSRWQEKIDHDPYFNPHFSRALEDFNIGAHQA